MLKVAIRRQGGFYRASPVIICIYNLFIADFNVGQYILHLGVKPNLASLSLILDWRLSDRAARRL